MTHGPLDRETFVSLLQSQITHYLMVEKYALRGDRNAMNDHHVVITPEEIASDVEKIFGKDNEELIEKLWWIINEAVASYVTSDWDAEV